MKKIFLVSVAGLLFACNSKTENEVTTSEQTNTETTAPIGQSGVKDDVSNPNVVQVAASSADHSTLVVAVKAAGLVDALSNAGPFTIFAPTNAAFDKLPKGTVEDLLKPENKNKLVDILQYHAYVGVLSKVLLSDGQEFEMVTPKRIKITRQGDDIIINGTAKVIGSVPASNGVIYVIDEVLVP